jgi:hypothetical protein
MTWLWRLTRHTHVVDREDYGAVLWQTGLKAGTTEYCKTVHCRRCDRWFNFD